jgi:FkbM family methyltransferase
MLIPFKKLQDRYGVKPKGVLHIGANVGEEAQAYKKAGIKNVVWVEANPEIYKTLVMNVAGYGHKTFNFCAGDENKEVVLHIANNNGQSSSILALGTHKKQHPEVKFTHDISVPMMRIDSFFSYVPGQSERYDLKDIDYLSLDIQGAELKALHGMGSLLGQFKWAYIEVNKAAVYENCPHVNEVDAYMKSFGFRRVVTAPWIGDWSDALYSKR